MALIFDRWFVAHPRSVEETYTEHFGIAARFGLQMIVGGVVCLVHALVPALFERTGSATINQTFRNTLDSVAASMRQYPNSLVDVYGYTDSTGSDAFNQRLSEQRAQAVASYLTSQGVASSRMRWQGFGENPQYFKGDNATDYGRALNRRVEFHILEQ